MEQLEHGAEDALAAGQFDTMYKEAVSLHPEDVAPYYAKAYYLFQTSVIIAKGTFQFTLHHKDVALCHPFFFRFF